MKTRELNKEEVARILTNLAKQEDTKQAQRILAEVMLQQLEKIKEVK